MAKTKTAVESALGTATDPNDDHRSALRQLLETIEQSWYDFSVMAYNVYQSEEYKTWGYETFKDYVEAELPISYRIAMWRVAVGEAIVTHSLERSVVETMGGYSNFGRLLPLIKKDTKRTEILAYLKKASKMTQREIEDFVATETSHTTGGRVVKKTKMEINLTNEQHTVCKEALDEAAKLAAGANGEPASMSIAFEYICFEWLEHHNPKKADEIRAKLAPVPEPKAKVVRKERRDKGKVRGKEKTSDAKAKATAKGKAPKKAATKKTKKAA